MAESAGRLQSVTTDATAINGIVDGAINLENAMLDTTTHDDDAARTNIYGRQSGTLEFTFMDDDLDAGQEELKLDFDNRTTSVYVFRMQTLSGADEYTATGLVSSLARSGPNDDPAEFTATITLTGAAVRTAQA